MKLATTHVILIDDLQLHGVSVQVIDRHHQVVIFTDKLWHGLGLWNLTLSSLWVAHLIQFERTLFVFNAVFSLRWLLDNLEPLFGRTCLQSLWLASIRFTTCLGAILLLDVHLDLRNHCWKRHGACYVRKRLDYGVGEVHKQSQIMLFRSRSWYKLIVVPLLTD